MGVVAHLLEHATFIVIGVNVFGVSLQRTVEIIQSHLIVFEIDIVDISDVEEHDVVVGTQHQQGVVMTKSLFGFAMALQVKR